MPWKRVVEFIFEGKYTCSSEGGVLMLKEGSVNNIVIIIVGVVIYIH